MSENEFRFDFPFQCKNGWPARLVGKVNRTAFPFVVAVWNPGFAAEEVHTYNKDGMFEGAFPSHPLALVNHMEHEAYYAIEQKTVVHASVQELEKYPPNVNPFRFDSMSMGTPLVRGWIIMHEGFGQPDFPTPLRSMVLVNQVSGQRFRVSFQPVGELELKARPPEEPLCEHRAAWGLMHCAECHPEFNKE
jgi:hypothetical protein